MKTRKIKTVLFPTDFSDNSIEALALATELTKKAGAKLVLLNIINTQRKAESEWDQSDPDLITDELIHFSKKRLQNLSRELQLIHGLHIETHTHLGEITPAIGRAVRKYLADIIVMGTKVEQDLFFKSTSYEIAKNTFIPMLTSCKGYKLKNEKNILFPFNENFNVLKKIGEVIQIAKIYRSKVILLGITEAVEREQIRTITNHMMHVKSAFDREGISCEIHFKSGKKYSVAILEYCENNQIDMIAVANHQILKLAEPKDSAAETIINSSKIPVLTIPV
jgi:nucleotide-binding universal stress UspA family protein